MSDPKTTESTPAFDAWAIRYNDPEWMKKFIALGVPYFMNRPVFDTDPALAASREEVERLTAADEAAERYKGELEVAREEIVRLREEINLMTDQAEARVRALELEVQVGVDPKSDAGLESVSLDRACFKCFKCGYLHGERVEGFTCPKCGETSALSNHFTPDTAEEAKR